jgi:uncharacterized protein YbaP (TraB family)
MSHRNLHFIAKKITLSLLIVGGLASGQAALAEPMQSKDNVKPSKPTPKKTQKLSGLLYEIRLPQDAQKSAKDGVKTAPAYLYATIHIAKANFYPLSAPVKKAYAQANTVVVEADTSDEVANRAVISKLSYAPGDKLQNHLTPATWATLTGMTAEAIEQFQLYKPVLVAMGLTVSAGMQLGYDPAHVLDRHFILAAKKDKKTLFELESVHYQADVLANLSDEEGDAVLANTLNSFKNGEISKEFNRMTDAWRAGDAERLAQIYLDASNRDIGSKKLTQKLMDERNPMMAQKIHDLMLAGKKLFIVMGSGHLAGDGNLIALLKQQGLQVQQIP